MKSHFGTWGVICSLVLSLTATANAQSEGVVGFDAGDAVINGIVSASIDSVSLLVLPLEFHTRVSDDWGVAGTLLLRTASSDDFGDSYDVTEVALLAGPRFSIDGLGLEGWFATAKVGLGRASGTDFDGNDDYARLDLVLQPEFGYATYWGSGGFASLSAGVRSMLPISETPAPIEWDGIGKMTHFYQPILNFTVGYRAW